MLMRVAFTKQMAVRNCMAPAAIYNGNIHSTRQFHSSWFKGIFGGKGEEKIAESEIKLKKEPV